MISHCAFARSGGGGRDAESIPVRSVEILAFDHSNWTEYKIECSFVQGRVPKETFATVRYNNGSMDTNFMKIEELSLELTDKAALCGPVTYSHTSWLKDWVSHYVGLGVDVIHLYQPTGPYFARFQADPHAFAESEEIAAITQKNVQFSVLTEGGLKHPNVFWHTFTPTPGTYGFGLRAVINECLSRVHYSHKYAIITDLDEFFWMRHDVGVPSVTGFMDKYLPESAASIAFLQLNYPMDCPVGACETNENGVPYVWQGNFGDLFALHSEVALKDEYKDTYHTIKEPVRGIIFKEFIKSIVRVNLTAGAHFHGVYSLVDKSKDDLVSLPHHIAHFKHIRYRGKTLCLFGRQAESNWAYNTHALLKNNNA